MAELPRLAAALSSTQGELQFSLCGMEIGRDQLGLHLELTGTLQLACQRCLGGIFFPLRHARMFCLTDKSPENVADEDPGVDFLPLNQKLDVLDLVEEEAMLSLPLAPMHATGQCEEASGALGFRKEPSPFSGLYKLKL
jgi:uncharacterized protein